MDGLNLKVSSNLLERFFSVDKFGSLVPRPEGFNLKECSTKVERQLSADTGLARRLTEMYYKTDVEFTDNPLGNFPTLGAGMKLFGPRPLKGVKFPGRIQLALDSNHSAVEKQLVKREAKMNQYITDLVALHMALKPVETDFSVYILWLVEGDQALTGGGFDNNTAGGVHDSALNFINTANEHIDYANTGLSRLVVEGSLWLRDQLKENGMREGSVKPEGASKVRFDQDSDGMIGWPVYAKANAPLTKEIAQRLMIESGVSTVDLVGSLVKDRWSGRSFKYRVVDALGYILDRLVLNGSEFNNVCTILARIQKHGYKVVDGKFEAKPGKTRSIYPPAAIPGMIEAMIMGPFMRTMKDAKVQFMPSLQNKSNRVDMIKDMITSAFSKDYDYLAADWSKYDATVVGAILATVMHIAVRPFINANYHSWLDFAIMSLVFKYLMLDESLAKINGDAYQQAKEFDHFTCNNFVFFPVIDGLISGAKFTHGGGSMYGEVVIHYVLPRMLGYEPIVGAQAGDDTLLGIPKALIDLSSADKTYGPIADAASKVKLKMNASKQIWHQVQGEVVKVFLQENYHVATNVYGIGSIFRPLSSLFTMERDKGLTVAEQLMAEIARMNQGYDSPFVLDGIKFWLEREQFLGILFKERGQSAFQVIVDSIGLPIKELAQRIDVGSFTWGIGVDDISNGNIPILPLIAQVAATMQFKVSISQALKSLEAQEREGPLNDIDDPDGLDEQAVIL